MEHNDFDEQQGRPTQQATREQSNPRQRPTVISLEDIAARGQQGPQNQHASQAPLLHTTRLASHGQQTLQELQATQIESTHIRRPTSQRQLASSTQSARPPQGYHAAIATPALPSQPAPAGQSAQPLLQIMKGWAWEDQPMYQAATRRRLLQGEGNQYDVPRRVGRTPRDVTGFIPGQRQWHKENLPEILYVLNSPPEWKAFKENRPGNMVDRHGNEVEEPFPEPGTRPRVLRDLRILPRIIGSQEEEWYFEAVRRLDPRIRWVDITMRMPKEDRPDENALQWRLSRGWRENLGMLSWHITSNRGRTGDRLVNDRVLSELSQEQRDNNTTRGLTPGLIDPNLGRDAPGNWRPWPKSKSGKDWGRALTNFTHRKRKDAISNGGRKSKKEKSQSQSPPAGLPSLSADLSSFNPSSHNSVMHHPVPPLHAFGNSQLEFGDHLAGPQDAMDTVQLPNPFEDHRSTATTSRDLEIGRYQNPLTSRPDRRRRPRSAPNTTATSADNDDNYDTNPFTHVRFPINSTARANNPFNRPRRRHPDESSNNSGLLLNQVDEDDENLGLPLPIRTPLQESFRQHDLTASDADLGQPPRSSQQQTLQGQAGVTHQTGRQIPPIPASVLRSLGSYHNARDPAGSSHPSQLRSNHRAYRRTWPDISTSSNVMPHTQIPSQAPETVDAQCPPEFRAYAPFESSASELPRRLFGMPMGVNSNGQPSTARGNVDHPALAGPSGTQVNPSSQRNTFASQAQQQASQPSGVPRPTKRKAAGSIAATDPTEDENAKKTKREDNASPRLSSSGSSSRGSGEIILNPDAPPTIAGIAAPNHIIDSSYPEDFDLSAEIPQGDATSSPGPMMSFLKNDNGHSNFP